MWDKGEVILVPYLKAVCTSFCSRKFYGLWCQKPLEDRLISYPYVFHFQHRLKSCLLRQTCFCGMIPSKTWLYSSLFLWRKSCVWSWMNFSATFDIKSNRETGLYFLITFLNKGFVFPILHCDGNGSSFIDRLIILVRWVAIT